MVLKNLFSGHQWRNRLKNRLVDMERGIGRLRCMERVMWKFTLPYVKQIASRGNSNRASVST